ncbi:MAG TPA: carbohydrate ABC transporter permease [bacterium]|nr:carbohydrate ABC transporter permease [bacterium]HQI48464.1 carbohydrate ABC transporter permease [bacterium]HQJ66357.1 carbohydrate ABC transporter permease [bacterium]
MNGNRSAQNLIFAVMTVIALFFLLPFIWILLTSLKPEAEVFSRALLPRSLHLENYLLLFHKMPFIQYLQNSVLISAVSVTGVVLSSSLVGYAFGCMTWPGRNFLFYFVIATMMLPMQVTMIPVFVIFTKLGWLNTFKPLTVPMFLGGGAFNIFLMRQFFMTVPASLLDAARIDGCSELGIWWRIVLPLARPALATVAILTFMFTWNDFLTPLIYLSDKAKGTLALGLGQLAGQQQPEWAVLMAASILMMLPVIVLFFLFQKYFIQGFTMSGIKE